MKICIYCRTSKREQKTENQRLILEQYATKMSYEFETFEEQESSRKTRPIKQDLMNRLRQKEFDGILVLKLDRFARSLPELVNDVQDLTERGVAFISLRDNLDLSNATGKLYFHILSAFCEFERSLIRERTLDGLERAKTNGVKLGRPAGAKDKKIRRRAGYLLRYSTEGRSDSI